MIDHVFFPLKEGLDTSGRTWQKTGIEKVGLFSVKIAYLDRKDNITYEKRVPVSWKDRKIAKSLMGRPMHMAELCDRVWLVRDWPWDD